MSGFAEGLLRSLDSRYNRIVRYLSSHWDEQPRVEILGTRESGADVVVRFRASRATPYVRVHVQHDGTGGGGATYDAATYASSERVDCRDDRQQDYTITRATSNNYYVWVAPEMLEGDGTWTRYTGESGEGEDLMAFAALMAPGGMVLVAPNGTRYLLSVSNYGGLYLTNLSTSAVRKFYAIESGDLAPTTVANETIYFEE